VGLYHDPEFYGVDYMSEAERDQFLAWHREQKDEIFSNREQLLAYCMDDLRYCGGHAAFFEICFLT
jgi:hypothetical protein